MGKDGELTSDTLAFKKTVLVIKEREMMKEVFFPGFPPLDVRMVLGS